jgi:hypothetical protein
MTQGSIWVDSRKNRGRKSCVTVPLNHLNNIKKTGGKKTYNFKPFHGQKYAENCGSEGLKLQTSKNIAIAELRSCGVAVAEQHFLKSCGIAIAEVLPSNCGIAIADSKKSCACPPLPNSHFREHPIA